jgi:hypothetical protein
MTTPLHQFSFEVSWAKQIFQANTSDQFGVNTIGNAVRLQRNP